MGYSFCPSLIPDELNWKRLSLQTSAVFTSVQKGEINGH